jgi:hypothetical protein
MWNEDLIKLWKLVKEFENQQRIQCREILVFCVNQDVEQIILDYIPTPALNMSKKSNTLISLEEYKKLPLRLYFPECLPPDGPPDDWALFIVTAFTYFAKSDPYDVCDKVWDSIFKTIIDKFIDTNSVEDVLCIMASMALVQKRETGMLIEEFCIHLLILLCSFPFLVTFP